MIGQGDVRLGLLQDMQAHGPGGKSQKNQAIITVLDGTHPGQKCLLFRAPGQRERLENEAQPCAVFRHAQHFHAGSDKTGEGEGWHHHGKGEPEWQKPAVSRFEPQPEMQTDAAVNP